MKKTITTIGILMGNVIIVSAREVCLMSQKTKFKIYKEPSLLGTVRKISVSAILNDDYEGGELLFSTIDDQEDQYKPQDN